jgi:transposase
VGWVESEVLDWLQERIDRKAPGQTPKLDAAQRAALSRLVEDGPIPAVHGVVRWRLRDLAQWIFEEFGITLDETTVGRTLKAMGYRKLSARPHHHAQNELALEDFKKPSRTRWRRSARRSAPASP